MPTNLLLGGSEFTPSSLELNSRFYRMFVFCAELVCHELVNSHGVFYLKLETVGLCGIIPS